MSLFKAFDFKKRDTVVHRLDPRTKLYLAIVLFIVSFLFNEVVVLSLIFFSLLLVLAVAKSLGQWFKTLRALSFILLFIVVINSIVVPYTYPLGYAITMVVRLLDIMACFSIFFLTVHPDDFAQVVIQLHLPFYF